MHVLQEFIRDGYITPKQAKRFLGFPNLRKNTTAEIRKQIAQYLRGTGHATSNPYQVTVGVNQGRPAGHALDVGAVVTHLRSMLNLNNYGKVVSQCLARSKL